MTKEEALETLAELSRKHGDVRGRLVKSGELVAVKRPSFVEQKRFASLLAEQRNGKTVDVLSAMRDYVLGCCVWPEDRKEARAVLEEFPGIISKLADSAAELASGESEELGND